MESENAEAILDERIESYVKKGYSHKSILKAFLESGYDKKAVEQSLRRFEGKEQHVLRIVLIIVIPIILTLVLLLPFVNSPHCESDAACFLERANRCEEAIYAESIGESVLEIHANDCVMTKRMAVVGKDEPASVVALLRGSSMECPYEPGSLTDDNLALTVGLGGCTGDLKSALERLSIEIFI